MNLPFLISVEPVSRLQKQNTVFLFIFITVGKTEVIALMARNILCCSQSQHSVQIGTGVPLAPFFDAKSFAPLKQMIFSAD